MNELRTLFGAMMRRRRVQAGLSQAELAQNIQRSLEQVSKMERGEVGASFDTIEQLCSALAIPPAALFGAETGAQDQRLQAILVRLADLDEEHLSWLQGVLDAILRRPR